MATRAHPQAKEIGIAIKTRVLNPDNWYEFFVRLSRRLEHDISVDQIELELTRKFRGLMRECRRPDRYLKRHISLDALIEGDEK